jgi:UDP-N-acetylglucosamine 1-carboxyvinyltransferase
MAVTPAVAEAFAIEGPRPLSGSIRVAGNKNGALPILAATLLTGEPVTLSNVPRIRDVETMIDLLGDLGADATWTGPNEVRVHTGNVARSNPDPRLCARMRASFLLAGPLLARFGSATMPPPGGDVIGRRRLDPHMHAFAELGANVAADKQYELRTDGLHAASVFLDEASVMATENTVMAAALTPGQTILGNAACEPHVQDLCNFLVSLGAQIEGIESNVLRITGVDSLTGGDWSIGPDHIEVGSFIGMAAISGGDVTIEGADPKDLVSIRPGFERLGVRMEIGETSVHVPSRQQLVIRDDLGGMIPKIEDGPWPAFPSDLTSVAITVATQAFGTVLMFEKMFENRLFFTDKLTSMGARIIVCDPHRAVVTGPTPLVGQRMESPDIRAGMAMLLAALCAEGRSTIGAVHQIDKGYERIDERLRALGASIERIEAPA